MLKKQYRYLCVAKITISIYVDILETVCLNINWNKSQEIASKKNLRKTQDLRR